VQLSRRINVPRGGLAVTLAGALVLAVAVPHADAAATLPKAAPAAAASKLKLTSTEASAQAKSTGKPVLATAMTTATREVTANPNGSFTMTISPTPVRVQQHGGWVPLDATLHANPDGTLSPAAVPDTLVLSDGGTAALATMTSDGQRLSLTLPASLPKPTVAGASATYANILPGTDLVVTATTQGGFSDVFVVHTPAAAADPRLTGLLKARISGSSDLSLRTDAAGDFTAALPNGHSAFTAPVAVAWDSATTPGAPKSAATAKGAARPAPQIPTNTRTALASTTASPGRYAHQADLGAALRDGTLTLVAPAALKTASAADFPLYYDPYFGPAVANFATVNSAFPGQPYINGSGTQGYMQVGYNGNLEGCNPCFNARSFVTLNMSGLPSGATNISAEVNFWDSWSASCTAEELDLWTVSPISTSSSNPTTWNNQPGWISQVTPGQSVAKGWSSSCPAGGIGWNISSQVQSVVNAHGPTLTLGLRIPASQESSNDDNWKQLNGNNSNQTETNASVTYDVKPNTPAGLYTSPATNCSTSNTTILGDTGVTLYAPVSTSTGANLTTTFDFYKTSASGTNLLTPGNGIASDTYSGASGKPAVMVLPESFIKTQSGTSVTTFAWTATTFDGTLHSGTSSPCTFAIDNSRPGAPDVTDDTTPPNGSKDCVLVPNTATEPVGTSCAFTFSPPNKATISGYTYQVNNALPTQINATGSVTVELNLPALVNTLTVSALSAGGNIGSAKTVWFDGTAFNPPETDGDLTADGTPDLIVPGNTSGAFSSGLWLAKAQRNGTVNSYASNIGASGLGFSGSAADWNGAQVITGSFCGLGAQDVLAYFPGTANAGGGAILCGTGTTQPLQPPVSGSQYDFGPATFVYNDADGTAHNASVIANGGSFTSADNKTTPYQLYYGIVPTGGTSGILTLFGAANNPNNLYNVPNSISTSTTSPFVGPSTPTGGTDWSNWTITTAQDQRKNTSGVLTTYTDMYLWDSTTGDLYLWAGVTVNNTSLDMATALTYTQYQIASGWNTGKSLTLRASDIAGTGNPGLWATDPSTGKTTAYIPPATLGANPTLTSSASSITTSTHSWQFTDIPTDSSGAPASGAEVTSTADGSGGMTLTNSSDSTTATGADWNTGDLYNPDVRFTGSNGFLATSGQAINLTQSFTTSFWTKPEADGTMALSESGASYPGLMIYPDGTGWAFYLAKDNGTTKWGGDSVIGGNIDYGVWTHIQASYNATTHVMSLYVDDTLVATGTHAIPSGSAIGPLVLGANIDGGTLTSFYTGQLADVETWSGTALAPNQPVTAASYHQPINPERILDTRQTATNTYSGIVENGTPLGAGNTFTVPVTADKVTPTATGVQTPIPSTATAVAIDVTLTSETGNGNLIAYADGTQRPDTSSTNYMTSTTVTGYQIVPLGQDGKIDLYNSSGGTTQVIVDITGYFTTDAALAGDQTYHPLASPSLSADRDFNTATATTNTTLTGTGPVAAGKTFNVSITGVDGIPTTSNVTGVAINLTTFTESGGGFLEAYPTGSTQPAALTSLTYQTNDVASMDADVPLGTGGKITIANVGSSSTDIIGDISGYYTNDTSGQVYHTVNPTRLVDTRIGIGNTTSTINPIPKDTAYPISAADTAQITTATAPTLSIVLTATNQTAAGNLVAYPDGPNNNPGTSNVNWTSTAPIANSNLALTPEASNGAIDIYNDSTGTTDLIADCSGYFANY
jgi:hypothetical protein